MRKRTKVKLIRWYRRYKYALLSASAYTFFVTAYIIANWWWTLIIYSASIGLMHLLFYYFIFNRYVEARRLNYRLQRSLRAKNHNIIINHYKEQYKHD